MILVNTSVWIDYFRGVENSESPPNVETYPKSRLLFSRSRSEWTLR